jgi:hypothetical protein
MSLNISQIPVQNSFPSNLCAVGNEYGERFNQEMSDKEKCYQGRWNPHMLASVDKSSSGNKSEENKYITLDVTL